MKILVKAAESIGDINYNLAENRAFFSNVRIKDRLA